MDNTHNYTCSPPPLPIESEEAFNEEPPRRGPGAPVGNRNACKKDFYTRHTATGRQPGMEEAFKITGLEQEIALLRHKLQLMEINNPDDVMLFFKGVDILSNVMARSRHIPNSGRATLLDGLRELLQGITIPPEAVRQIMSHEVD
jgi:hypothetical protein